MPANARRFIAAFLAGDIPSATALIAPGATFHSPIRDYAGAERVGSVWREVAGVVSDARTTSVHEHDCETVAMFSGAIKGRPVDGVLRTLTDRDDRIVDVTLMIRPWGALKAGLADLNVQSSSSFAAAPH
jgi:hypothetical protein